PKITDSAMAADLKAATSQSQKADPAEQAKLYDTAIGFWEQAVELCDGRAKDRALRNLADNQRVRKSLEEMLGSGAECAGSQKDANALQELARQATTERRWQDAASLYRKAENMWDLAAERCSGAQQQLATQKRDQVAIDGHNVEFCAPRFERAREFQTKFRNTSATLTPTEKQTQQQITETLWREAVAQCKGAAGDLARNNAQTVSRERGTAWTAMLPPDLPSLPTPRANPPAAAPAAATPARNTAGTGATTGAAPASVANGVAGAVSTA
ncbi:MAG: hypothetical protein CFE45_35700, partial [Burkholderiales bacterium PBB5]